MMVVIGNLLSAAELAEVRKAADALEFGDGKRTAGRYVKDVKSNLQALPSDGLTELLNRVKKILKSNDTFKGVARPKDFATMLLSRYRGGMSYGTHVDNPVMQGHRTDLSFTLSLSDPDSYEGGELVIEDALEERGFKLNAGDLVLYPTSALHRVEAVTKGERMAIVGWVTSWVRDPARREILYDLDTVAHQLFEAEGKTPAFDRLFKAKANLARMWYDD